MKVSKQMARDLQGTEEGMSEFEGSTPGPWTAEPGDSVLSIFAEQRRTNSCGGRIATVCSQPYWKALTGEDEANARLIAAAPDLLAERDALAARVAELEAHLGTALQYWSGHFTSRFDELLGQDRNLEGNEFRKARALIQEPKP